MDRSCTAKSSEASSPFRSWARATIADRVSEGGAAINAVCLAEICVGDRKPETVADRIRSWGIEILDIPSAAALICAKAYLAYQRRRKAESGKDAPRSPLPDFLIGAHAEIMEWPVATTDPQRFKTYFPAVDLETP